MKIGDFLLRRLKEAGVRQLFGVPADYNLELLQKLQDAGALEWIGTCSGLSASYAADSYARLNCSWMVVEVPAEMPALRLAENLARVHAQLTPN
jgi:TPP-dependent 2-oxoacid decarboxylase